MFYRQVTCLVQPPVTDEAAEDAAAASAISVYVEEPQPDVPDESATARLFPCVTIQAEDFRTLSDEMRSEKSAFKLQY